MTQVGTRQLTLTINGVERAAEVDRAKITSAATEADFTPYSATATGGSRDYFLECRGVQDTATATFWDLMWSQAGATIPYVLRPHGNVTPTPAQPHFTGNVVITEPEGDLLGGDANSSASARQLVETKWACTAKPTKVTA